MNELKDEWIEATSSGYTQVMQDPYHVFNTYNFTQLNSSKCDEVSYLLFKDSKYRLGLAAGVRGGILLSPFSAPFGGFSFLKQDVQIAVIEKAVDALEGFAKQKRLVGIQIVLPPLIYNETFISKQINVLYRSGYRVSNIDLDFVLPLFGNDDDDKLKSNSRRNLRISKEQGFEVNLHNSDLNSQKQIYEIIEKNRKAKGYPLNMSWDDIHSTSKVIKTDFFLLTCGDTAVASAIVFRSAHGIRYVPFWGDHPDFTHQKPMYFLANFIAKYYSDCGDKYLHIGIATEKSVPNYGLCEFKEAIGATSTPKMSFEKFF